MALTRKRGRDEGEGSERESRISDSRKKRKDVHASLMNSIDQLTRRISDAHKESKEVHASMMNLMHQMTMNAPKHSITGMYNNNMQLKQLLLMKQYLDADDEFWDMVACALCYIVVYYLEYVHEEPCMTSSLTGEKWMNENLNGPEKRCFSMFRMNQDTFRQLCMDLESKYGLRPSNRMSILEKVGLFVYVLKGASHRDIQEHFQHSSETLSRVFKEVLNSMDGFSMDVLVPKDPEFKDSPPQIADDARYMPHFKDCIGAIDCTHIPLIVVEKDQMRYTGKKGIPTTNVLAACDFDMVFTYVITGWEGSADDAHILLDTVSAPNLNFPKPPAGSFSWTVLLMWFRFGDRVYVFLYEAQILGKYYLVDKDYQEKEGYLTPYPKVRYLHSEFRGANPRGSREVFNRAHSSLRSCIERAFGVLKARWKILEKVPEYSYMDQNRIICSCFALHNYIRRNARDDPGFKVLDQDPGFIPPEVLRDVEANSTQCIKGRLRTREMKILRNNISSSLMAAR